MGIMLVVVMAMHQGHGNSLSSVVKVEAGT